MKIKTRIDNKLHCNVCGCKRHTKLAIPFPKEDGSIGLAFIVIKTMLKYLKAGTLPNQKGFEFPKEGLFGCCGTCNQNTYYKIENNKIVVVD